MGLSPEIERAMAEDYAMKREIVHRETWGHEDAQPGVKYPGTILFADGAFPGSGQIVLRSEFGEAGYGPWFYEGIHDWLWRQETERGQVYRFTGWYRLGRDGGHEFEGEIVKVEVADA